MSEQYKAELSNSGFRIDDVKELDNEYVKQFNSLWAKRLAFGRKTFFLSSFWPCFKTLRMILKKQRGGVLIMKKNIAKLLVLVIAISLFSGCANKNKIGDELKTIKLWSGYCMIAEDELEMEKSEWILRSL